MTRLLIPQKDIALTGDIQHVLLLAHQQGFDIKNITLGVSPTTCCQINEWTIDSDCLISSQEAPLSGCNLFFQYQSAISSSFHAAKNVVQLALGAQDAFELKDQWYKGQELCSFYYSSSLESSNSGITHFAWVLALLSLDFPLEDALVLARAAMNVSRETWPAESSYFPKPTIKQNFLVTNLETNNDDLVFPVMNQESLGLYPVVDSVDWIERLLKMGVKTIQLRIKDTEHPELESNIIKAIKLGQKYNAQVFINDHWQLAIKHQAFGVHLGQEDIETADLEQIAKAGLCLGLSTHGYYELLRVAQLKPSYIALGHIFPTTTKQMPSKPQGLVRLKLYQQLIDDLAKSTGINPIPTVAIGGIDLNNAEQVWQCGVSSLAVVRAITEAKNTKVAIQSFNSIMQLSELNLSAEERGSHAF
ncbi:thiamine phosphate synthase [Vibrio aestuarianus subsp. cardii]|uniref:thiamine phosphate synthase n=1 Tax=Vibrio aestuarianus TaxID=28171 RepID=UPI0015588243|nr:thiamine phosphate synthase [Vibrio aestuarianus]NGZ67545.1 thiamine phosphate synthase [Vibrio aestuarianus subsp. cardii]